VKFKVGNRVKVVKKYEDSYHNIDNVIFEIVKIPSDLFPTEFPFEAVKIIDTKKNKEHFYFRENELALIPDKRILVYKRKEVK